MKKNYISLRQCWKHLLWRVNACANFANLAIAAPYILETLVDLTKRAHKDPSARNVYLNPSRADQVMVFSVTSWEVIPLIDAIRSLFDSVAGNIRRIIKCNDERVSLSPPVQATAPWIPAMYDDEHEKYAADAKPTMSAHLRNIQLQIRGDLKNNRILVK